MNELVKVENNQIVATEDFLKIYKEKKQIAEEFELMEKELKQILKEGMEANNIEKISGCGIYAELKYSKGKRSIDTKRLEEELPDIYEYYLKQGNPYSSLTLKFMD